MRTILLIGQHAKRPFEELEGAEKNAKTLLGAEIQRLQKEFGEIDKDFRFITRNPPTAEAVLAFRRRPQVILVLTPRGDWQFPEPPLTGEPGEKLAPLRQFTYERGEQKLSEYVHRKSAQRRAA